MNINVEQNTLNIKSLAPKFDFGTGVATLMNVVAIPKEDDRQKLANSRVYSFSHISNILSGMFPLLIYLFIFIGQDTVLFLDLRSNNLLL